MSELSPCINCEERAAYVNTKNTKHGECHHMEGDCPRELQYRTRAKHYTCPLKRPKVKKCSHRAHLNGCYLSTKKKPWTFRNCMYIWDGKSRNWRPNDKRQ
jgi:hypothetical protein